LGKNQQAGLSAGAEKPATVETAKSSMTFRIRKAKFYGLAT
jgi:hypothetical protein